mmetsp:Transcript_38674/g.124300  ORF Transcript_38674/g.124300 Transcript_38674/m.124300 type:complete len:107 (+) Transcript_38674:237-557(+)
MDDSTAPEKHIGSWKELMMRGLVDEDTSGAGAPAHLGRDRRSSEGCGPERTSAVVEAPYVEEVEQIWWDECDLEGAKNRSHCGPLWPDGARSGARAQNGVAMPNLA